MALNVGFDRGILHKFFHNSNNVITIQANNVFSDFLSYTLASLITIEYLYLNLISSACFPITIVKVYLPDNN